MRLQLGKAGSTMSVVAAGLDMQIACKRPGILGDVSGNGHFYLIAFFSDNKAHNEASAWGSFRY